MSEWKEYRIGDICDCQTGPFGSQLHNEDYVEFGTPIVTVEHLGNKKFTIQNLPFVSDSDVIRLSKYTMAEGDIVFSRVGSVDRCSYVSKSSKGWLFSGRCIRIRTKNANNLNPEYLYYYLSSEITKRYIRNIAVGATMPSINTKLINQVPIILPSINTQHKIAAILSSLDDKIETNRAINARLEELAAAIFKSWFIDFEPFADGEFIEDEHGRRPKGWKIVRLEEIADIIGGGTPSKDVNEYFTLPYKGIAWLTPKDLSNHPDKFTSHGEVDITELGYKKSSTKIMPAGTVLFSSRAPIGYISIALNDICTNQGFKSAVPLKVSTEFLFYTLSYKRDEIENKSTGSTFKEASGSLMKSIKVILPKENIIADYTKLVFPIFEKQKLIEVENTRLASLRDTLLPRLMSGEIKVY